MMTPKTLLAFYAHPDDEVLGVGGALAKYAAEGVHIEFVCATRGEAGEIADPALATPETLPAVREAELRCSAQALGVKEVTFLDFRDSGMAETAENQHPHAFINAPDEAVIPQLVQIIRRTQPQVIVTFEPYGGYGHPDHLAIHRHTHVAITAAADPHYHPELGAPWSTPRLFYPILLTSFFAEMKTLMQARDMDTSMFDRIEESITERWPDELVHCVMDISGTVEAKWTALHCHRTQFGPDNLFRRLPEEEMKTLLSREYFALAIPQPEAGLTLDDLFAGL